MFLIVLSVCLALAAVAVLVAMVTKTDSSKHGTARLAALDHEFAPTADEETAIDIRKDQRHLSRIPWLNGLLTKLNLAQASSLYLYQAGVTKSLGALALISIAGSAVVGTILSFRFGAGAVPLVLAAAFLFVPFLYVRRKRAKRLSKLEQQLPEALGMMVSALRVGHSLIASVGAVAQDSAEPLSGEMRKCFDEQSYGVDLRTALVNLTERVPIQDFRIFVAAVMVQKESGGNLAEVLEKVAQTTRERFRLKKQVSVHTAQGRMTGWVLSFLPLGLGLLMYFINPEGMSVLWKRPLGLKMLYTAVGMDVVGALIIRKVVRIRV
jgi:tight adherence protein B